MSRVQGKDSDLSSELPFSNLKDRCEACRNISTCNVCGISISGFEHIGVRATSGQESGIWHYASPCRHRNQLRATAANVKYGGGPPRERGDSGPRQNLGAHVPQTFRSGLRWWE